MLLVEVAIWWIEGGKRIVLGVAVGVLDRRHALEILCFSLNLLFEASNLACGYILGAHQQLSTLTLASNSIEPQLQRIFQLSSALAPRRQPYQLQILTFLPSAHPESEYLCLATHNPTQRFLKSSSTLLPPSF